MCAQVRRHRAGRHARACHGRVAVDGFDWVDAAIGAAAALGIALLATGAALVVRRRMHRDEPVAVA